MVNNYVRQQLPDVAMVFDNPAFDNSIVGYTEDGNAVYDYDKMISELMKDDNIPYDAALDFVEFNTLRAIPYAGAGKPIIVYGVDKE